MKRIALQHRLRLLAEMTPPGGRARDISTDHGYYVWLLQEGRILRHRRRWEQSRWNSCRTAEEYETQGLDFRLCDGLSGIEPEETDTVVIAGRAKGETIRDIPPCRLHGRRTANGDTRQLKPMTSRWSCCGLAANGYSRTEERLVQDKGKLYVILSVTGGSSW